MYELFHLHLLFRRIICMRHYLCLKYILSQFHFLLWFWFYDAESSVDDVEAFIMKLGVSCVL